jgi:hypothetical protein
MSKKEEQPKAIEPEHVATGAPVSNGEPVIQTIPEKFYGAALKAKLVDPGALSDTKKDGKKPSAALSSGPKKGMGTGVVIIALFVLLGGAGGLFVYFNQDLIFPPPEEEPDPLMEEDVLPPPPPPPPSAPSDLTATSTNPTVVQLSWVDTSEGEAGFRVERRIATSEYRSLTSLPPNATAFQDNSVQADTSYLYRIIALSEGGESPASNEVTVTTLPTPPPPPEQPV